MRLHAIARLRGNLLRIATKNDGRMRRLPVANIHPFRTFGPQSMRRVALSGRPAVQNLLIPCLLLAAGCTAEHGPPLGTAWVAPAMPDTPKGKQVAAYLEAFNSGNEAALASFIRENATPVGPGG